jgi:hypothetical protein
MRPACRACKELPENLPVTFLEVRPAGRIKNKRRPESRLLSIGTVQEKL